MRQGTGSRRKKRGPQALFARNVIVSRVRSATGKPLNRDGRPPDPRDQAAIPNSHVLPGQQTKRLPPQTGCALRMPRSSDQHWSCDLADLLASRLDGSTDPAPPGTSVLPLQFQCPSAGPYDFPQDANYNRDNCTYIVCTICAMTADHDGETRQPKSGRLGLRTNDWQRSILAAASRAEGATVSEFVLKYATRAAEEVLADRRAFVLSEPQWSAFTDALDRPPRSFLRLRNVMVIATTSTGTGE